MTTEQSVPSYLGYLNKVIEGGPEEVATKRALDVGKAVIYQGPWEDPFSGFSEHARRCARALNSVGVPVRLNSTDARQQLIINAKEPPGVRSKINKEHNDLHTLTAERFLATVVQLVPNAESLSRFVVSRFYSPEQMAIKNSRKIIYTVWERNSPTLEESVFLNKFAQNWVASNKDAQMLRRALGKSEYPEDRIKVIPIPYFPNDPRLPLNGRPRFAGVPRFYHIGKWEPRKAQHEMIGAFLIAFKPGEAKLYIKTSTSAPVCVGYPQHAEFSVNQWLEQTNVKANGWTIETVNADISLIKQFFSEEQITQLHRTGDVYVSLSRGEGFDMPAFDAKLAGNLMIYTPSGGPQDFAGEQDELVPVSGNLPCHPFYGWKDCTYLDYNVDDAVRAFRYAYEKIQKRVRVRGCSLEGFTATSVGARMRSYIEELCGESLI